MLIVVPPATEPSLVEIGRHFVSEMPETPEDLD